MTKTPDIHTDKILILDFGSQYSQLIARRVRELGVYCEIHSYDMSAEAIKNFAPKGIILSGGPNSTTAAETPRAPTIVFELGCPVLGICYGMQTMAMQLGGNVEIGAHHEYGFMRTQIATESQLFTEIVDYTDENNQKHLDVWMSHGDRVTVLPNGFKTIAMTTSTPVAAIADESRHFYGVQFHPEVTHTVQGHRILERFLRTICHCKGLWQPQLIVENLIQHIHQQVGPDEEVILGLSGGVDSSVLAVLLHKALGDRLICVFVDTGLLRLNEKEQVLATFAKHFNMRVSAVDAKEFFFDALEGVSDPEEKRKCIGKVFIDMFEQEARKYPKVKWLAQGTIYSDVIESAGSALGNAVLIKSHHNVGGLPERMHLKLLEPLRELFKDEVRRVGLELGLPYELLHRHPFPGPGLGVRILGEIHEQHAVCLRLADEIFLEELHRADWYHKVKQAFAVFLPIKSVAVKGDNRAYEYVIALRAVETDDFMTARWAHLPYELLGRVSNRIINEVPGISRVTYDISSKPPATIEWE